MAELKVCNVSKSFDNRKIIEDISIELREGELVSLLGTSGGGKTTLFNIIAGIMEPDNGQIFLGGQDITGKSGQISYMLQKDLLLPYKTIEDNVSLPLVLKGMKKKEAREQVGDYFQEFGLEGTQKKYPHQLSGGMRQRAALLRTYMFSGEIALLDEPFSALDTLTKREMHKWYLGIMDKIKLSTLFITHDIDEAILLSNRIYLLTGNPGTISHMIEIKKNRERTDGFELMDEFLEYKKEILKLLNIST